MTNVTFRHEPERRHYVICVDDEPAGFVAYREEPGLLIATHAEIDDAYGGQGLGSRLAVHVLESARDAGLGVVPLCPFVREYVARHPEWLALVPESRRGPLGL